MIDPHGTSLALGDELVAAFGTRHRAAVVLGTGWGDATAAIGTAIAQRPFTKFSGLGPTSASGHRGRVVSVRTGGGLVLVFEGRVHLYEGHDPDEVALAVRAAVRAGAEMVVLTNAAGGINPGYRVGQGVLIADHLNLTTRSPLTGPVAPAPLGGRHVDLTDCWSTRLRQLARSLDPSLAEGVYAGLAGPHFETPAEIVMLRTLGADLVGMSTVIEAIAARHLGAEVLGISLVTNAAAGMPDADLSHDAVFEAAATAAGKLGALIGAVVAASLLQPG